MAVLRHDHADELGEEWVRGHDMGMHWLLDALITRDEACAPIDTGVAQKD